MASVHHETSSVDPSDCVIDRLGLNDPKAKGLFKKAYQKKPISKRDIPDRVRPQAGALAISRCKSRVTISFYARL